MKIIVTVVGKDRIGIIAGICDTLAKGGANVLDISQTILDEYFNMIMIVECDEDSFTNLLGSLKAAGASLGVEVKAQRQEVFDAMHRV